MSKKSNGRIAQIIGPVIDVVFDKESPDFSANFSKFLIVSLSKYVIILAIEISPKFVVFVNAKVYFLLRHFVVID